MTAAPKPYQARPGLVFPHPPYRVPPMGRTSDARQRLIDAANDLIWEYSYGAITIDAICERAAVKKGSFYYFFESKSDLAVTAIDAWWRGREQVIDKIF